MSLTGRAVDPGCAAAGGAAGPWLVERAPRQPAPGRCPTACDAAACRAGLQRGAERARGRRARPQRAACTERAAPGAAGCAGRCHRAAVAGRAGQRRGRHRPLAGHAPSRHQALLHRRAQHGQRRLGAAGRRPALQRAAGGGATGQPQRRAQRDRVFRVRAQAAGLCRRRGCHARLPRHARRGRPGPRARWLCRPAGRTTDGAAGGPIGGLVGGLCAAVCRPPGSGARRRGRTAGAALGRGRCSAGAGAGVRCPGGARRGPAGRSVARGHPQPGRAPDAGHSGTLSTWHKVAHALAEDMDADLLDDAGRPITLHAFDAIGRDLAQLYAALETHDLAAGSPAARRLFAG